MGFDRKILHEELCPRCNAVAQVRVTERANVLVVNLECPKCRLRENRGLTTKEGVNLMVMEEKLTRQLLATDNQYKKSLLRAKLARIRRQRKMKELAL